MTKIIVPIISDALQDSVIYEAYRGNFAHARLAAEAALAKARQQNAPSLLADALLARGIVHLLQGEPVSAQICLRESAQHTPMDAERQLRAENYAYLATHAQYNSFPDGSGASALEIEQRWSPQTYIEEEVIRWQELMNQVSVSDLRLESWLVHELLCMFKSSHAFLHSSRFNVSTEIRTELLKVALSAPLSFQRNGASVDADPHLLAFSDLVASALCHQGGDFDLRQQFLQRALAGYQSGDDPAGVAACYMMWGDWLSAPFSTPLVWNFAIQDGATEGSNLSWTLEEAEFDHQNLDETNALGAFQEAERLFRTAGAPRGLAAIEIRYGYLAFLRGDYQAAVRHAQQAGVLFQETGDWAGYWLAEAHRLMAQIGTGHWNDLQDTAQVIGKWGKREGSFSYTLGLGFLLCRFGRYCLVREADFEKALASYRLAEKLFRSLGATINAAQSYFDQGDVYNLIGDHNAALTIQEQALDLYQEAMDTHPAVAKKIRLRLISLAHTIFNAYSNQMNTAGMERSINRIKRLTPKPSADHIDPFAIVESTLSTLKESLLSSDQSQKFTDAPTFTLGDYALVQLANSTIEQAEVTIPLYKARHAKEKGDKTTLDELYAAALKNALAASAGDRDYLEAIVWGHQRQFNKATIAFEKYLAQGGTNAGIVGNLNQVFQMAGGEQARLEAEKQSFRTYELAFIFFVTIKAYEQAKIYLDRLVQAAGEDWWRSSPQPWLSLSDRAEVYEGLGDLPFALTTYQQALAEFDSQRRQLKQDTLRVSISDNNKVKYLHFQATRAAVKHHLAENKDQVDADALVDFGEKGKARALLDLMASSTTMARTAHLGNALMRRWRELNARLTLWQGLLARAYNQDGQQDAAYIQHLKEEIAAAANEIEQLEAVISRDDPNIFNTLNPQANTLSLEQISRLLPSDTVLLQYYFLGEDFLAWAITRQGLACVHHQPIEEYALDQQIRSFYQSCITRTDDNGLGEKLAETLLSPFAEVIAAYPNIIFVPFGTAHILPFQALPWKGEALINSHAISYLPSASTLQFLQNPHREGALERILVVGNPENMALPSQSGDQIIPLPRLAEAEVEARYVATLFPQSKLLIGRDATEEAVREHISHYPILHFATHGYLSEETPLLSSISLAEGEGLNVYELMGMHVDADLVVLSACRTALGQATAGDDVLGLTRGLLGAGAKSAVVSLWPVDDLSTSLFMGEFYRCLQTGQSPTKALQTAQNYLRALSPETIKREISQVRDTVRLGAAPKTKDYRHPFYWAPFVLVGI